MTKMNWRKADLVGKRTLNVRDEDEYRGQDSHLSHRKRRVWSWRLKTPFNPSIKPPTNDPQCGCNR
ncbi:hypothetical protein SAMN05428953_102209 [Mesorhizobium muleiense]|uniref:Uncharacterized protein n=1 Tax=Mesorhizobium muleiense TaxID=1004279 RepID=A0A1G8LDI6_9HYPH|nr:hypothetical protein SAMN05428953_102209 [Mesorhizobium muleiense]